MLVENLLVTTGDKYALLKITEQTDEVLQGERRVFLKRAKSSPGQKNMAGREKKGSGMRKSDILNSRGLALFEQLRGLRTQIAREENVPPYIIFTDKTLVDMCVKLPFSRADMMKVSGVGENKYARYGERFLSAIEEYTGGIREKFYFGEL